ncbi:MAG: ATP-binding protein [Aquabacterium sp.]
MPAALHPRFLLRRIQTALADTPVVLINGPRQCGKSTLAMQLAGPGRPYLTLDDPRVLAAACADPLQFLLGLSGAVIDEIQRAPDLLPALKHAVDTHRTPGRWVLTGSADLLAVPRVADSLAGRMEVLTLLPLSAAEVRGVEPRFLERVFDGVVPPPPGWPAHDRTALMDEVLTGGYPPMRLRSQPERRRAWAQAYLRAVVERDVRDIADVHRLDLMPRLLRAAAAQAGQITNYAALGAALSLDEKTARRHLGLFETLFLLRRLEPWHRNELSRLVKTPKLHFLDSGLLAALKGIDAGRLAADRTPYGVLMETWVGAELRRQMSWRDEPLRLSYLRTKDQHEVDYVLERDDGALVGIEVKAGATVRGSDFDGLRWLARAAGTDLRLGLVLYDGELALPFGDRLWAVPVTCLLG